MTSLLKLPHCNGDERVLLTILGNKYHRNTSLQREEVLQQKFIKFAIRNSRIHPRFLEIRKAINKITT